MSVILITANFKFRNRSTCSKGPIKRAGKVCGDSQDLKSPGLPSGFCISYHAFMPNLTQRKFEDNISVKEIENDSGVLISAFLTKMSAESKCSWYHCNPVEGGYCQ